MQRQVLKGRRKSFHRNGLAVEKQLKRGALTPGSLCPKVGAGSQLKAGPLQESEAPGRSQIVGAPKRSSP
jgi:hypothetical protein